jgi:hypothetical protein
MSLVMIGLNCILDKDSATPGWHLPRLFGAVIVLTKRRREKPLSQMIHPGNDCMVNEGVIMGLEYTA